MKLTMVLITITIMQVSATGFAQKITLKQNDISLEQLFKAIRKQTGYNVLWMGLKAKDFKKIDADFKETPLNDVLKKSFENQSLAYEIDNRTIIVRGVRKVPVKSDQSANTVIDIRGRVVDAENKPIPGASVKVKSTGKAVVTDTEGRFQITGIKEGVVLEVSFIGYETVEIKAGADLDNIVLKQSDAKLEEIVVVGYGSRSKKNLLQSVSSINAKQITEIPASNLSQSMAARVPGLFVSTAGGKPGRSSSVRIRAYDGFGAAQPPLYVIDGMIVDQFAFDGLDASEVETISVLKDGASAAVYGVRGANGVIVVTTKKGAKGEPSVNFISSYSIDEATKIPETLSAYDEAMLTNDNLRYGKYAYSDNPNGYLNDQNYYADDELEYWKTHSTNLLDNYFKQPTQLRNTLNISGGTDRVKYFASGSFYKGTGAFDNVDFKRYNMRARIDAQIINNLNLTVSLNSDVRKDDKPFWLYDSDSDDLANLYQGLLTRTKMGPDYITVDGKSYPVGNLVKWHPGEVVNGNTGYNRKNWSNYQAMVDLTYAVPFVEGLKLRGTFSNYSRNDYRKLLNLPYKLYTFNSAGSKGHLVGDQIDLSKTFDRNDGNYVNEVYNRGNLYQLNFYLNFDRSFGKHNISAMAVYEQSETHDNNFSALNQFVLSRELDQISLASSDSKDYRLSGGEFEDGRLAGLGKLAYDYAGKYFIEGAFRYEGSRYFIPSNRYALFPSVSAGWRVSEERFLKDKISFLNDLKLRGSLGYTGAEPQNPDGSRITSLQWDQSYRKTSGAFFGTATNGITVGTIPNRDITWAKKRSIEFGFDAAFMQNALTLRATRFLTRRTDILGSRTQSVPSTFGGSLPAVNYGIMESNGYEVDLSYRKSISNNLTIFGALNYGYAVNKQVLIDQASNIRPYQSQLGRSTGGILGYISTGIIRTQEEINKLPQGYTIFGQNPRLGMLNYKDIRGATTETPDGKIDGNDQEFIAKYTQPPSVYGLSLGATWKSFSIDVLIQGTGKYYGVRSPITTGYGQEQGSFGYWKDHWTPNDPNAAYPLYGGSYLFDVDQSATSTFWLDNRSFIRLKNINLGWTVPSHFIQKTGLKEVRFFFNGTNLFLLKDKIKLYDPEAASMVSYPINRNYTFGINVTL